MSDKLFEIDALLRFVESVMKADTGAGGVVTLLGGERFYAFGATPGAPFPRVVYTPVPLRGAQGQTGLIYVANAVVQFKVTTEGAMTATSMAVAARVQTLFGRRSRSTFETYKFSSRFSKPILHREPGATAETFFMNQGGEYRFWQA